MTVTTATKTSRPRAISGWPLDHLIALDAAHPGILRFALQSSPLRRQGIFLTLSYLRPGSPEDLAARLAYASDLPRSHDPLATIATALVTLRVRDLAHALHPGVEGLVGRSTVSVIIRPTPSSTEPSSGCFASRISAAPGF